MNLLRGGRKIKYLTILTPVYNDWTTLEILLNDINENLLEMNFQVNIVFVDDGSILENKINLSKSKYGNIDKIYNVELTRNLGHQRAIAIGLAYIQDNIESDAVLIMDSDGEDSPKDISLLVKTLIDNPDKIIFASRAKRSEGVLFKLFYSLYINLFYVFTGYRISFGNFSIIPQKYLKRLISMFELWNHFPAAIIRSKLPYISIPTIRAKRYSGSSKMNLQTLILHGLSSISVYIEYVGVRILIFTTFLIIFSLFGMLVVLWIRFMTDMAIPGWATNVSFGLILVFLQSFLISLFLIFIILSARSNLNFIPARDYKIYINQVKKVN